MPSPTRLFNGFHAAGTNGRRDHSLCCPAPVDALKSHRGYNQDLKIHSEPRRVSLLVCKALLVECLKV